MVEQTLLWASLGWFLVITFGLLALVILIGGRDASGMDGGAMVFGFLLCITVVVVGAGILFGGDFATPGPYTFNFWAILLGISPLIVAVVAFLVFVWKQMEADENARVSRM